MSISEEFAREVDRLRTWPVPEPVARHARCLLLDFCGNALAGSRTESFRMAVAGLGHVPPGPFAVVGQRGLAVPEAAALLNGMAAHSLEMDDTHARSSSHIGAAVLPAMLAAAQMVPVAGTEALRAMVAGYEVVGRVGAALDPRRHYARGFHPTATCGPYGAAAAVSCLFGLSRAETAHALGIASVGSAGLLEFLADGALTKRLHPGWAAHAGLLAALLARAGYTGPVHVFEGPSGFFRAYSDGADPAAAAGRWEPPGRELLATGLKPHACCRYNQPAIDGVLELLGRHRLDCEDIAEIRVGVLSVAWNIVVEPLERKLDPRSVVDAQFSLPYAVAVAAKRRRASAAEYTEEAITDPGVRDLMKRVRCFRDATLDAAYPERWPATVEIESRSGRRVRVRIDDPRGDPANPLRWEDVVDKFQGLASHRSEQTRREIIDSVDAIEAMPDVGALVRSLGA